MQLAKANSLPYPISSTIYVFKDDGKWDSCRAWFLRTQGDIEKLFVCTYKLRTTEDDDVALTHDEWEQVCEQMQTENPNCIYVYS